MDTAMTPDSVGSSFAHDFHDMGIASSAPVETGEVELNVEDITPTSKRNFEDVTPSSSLGFNHVY
jgi:hypothetical protein